MKSTNLDLSDAQLKKVNEMEKVISKTAQLKLDRARRKEEKREKAKAKRDRIESLVNVATELTSKMHSEFQSWGVVRTRAFMNLVEIVRYRSTLKHVKEEGLSGAINLLRAIPTMPLERCQELSDVGIRSREL